VSKYANSPVVLKDIRYDSKREAAYDQELLMRLAAGDIVRREHHVRIPLFGKAGSRISTYVADYRLTYPDGRIELVDVKGHKALTCKCQACVIFRLKRKWVLADYGLAIKVVR
jgi:hypothetical protein